MPAETSSKSQEPAEGSRKTVERELDRTENRRESGARKLSERPNERRPDPIHTGDRGDEPPGSRRGENPLESDDE